MGLSRSAVRERIGHAAGATGRETTKTVAKADAFFDSTTSYLTALGFVLFFGALVRVGMLFIVDFPLNDGGMFMQAIIDLQRSHFALPQSIHYNGLPIPYAYPPLGFYVAGLFANVTHLSIPTVLRIIPATFSVLTIVAFMLLANSFLRNRTTVVAASLAFALVPRSHNWEIMGGGLTRSIGFFFATLAIWQAYLLFTERSRSALVWTTIFAALACLSHLEMAWFVAFSAVLLFLAYGRTRTGFRDSVLVSVGILVLTSPWWATVIARHGIEPFLNAGQTGSNSITVILALLLTLNWGNEPFFPIFGSLALIGILYCTVRRRYFLPLWVFVGLVLDPRKFETEAMVPMAMIVGICVSELLIPLVQQRVQANAQSDEGTASPPVRARRAASQWIGPIAVAIVVVYGLISSVTAVAVGDAGLSVNERQAMNWVSQSTAPNSHFAIITGDIWATDRTSEWFPVLAGRDSVATVQGYEWLPNGAFSNQKASYLDLQKCASRAADCISNWATDQQTSYDYVYIASRELIPDSVYFHVPCCSGLVASLESDPSYQLVFQNDGAAIFKHTPASTSRPSNNATIIDRGRKQTPL